MEDLQVERLDHLGTISGIIKDLGLIERIDARIVPLSADKNSLKLLFIIIL